MVWFWYYVYETGLIDKTNSEPQDNKNWTCLWFKNHPWVLVFKLGKRLIVELIEKVIVKNCISPRFVKLNFFFKKNLISKFGAHIYLPYQLVLARVISLFLPVIMEMNPTIINSYHCSGIVWNNSNFWAETNCWNIR